MADAYDALVLAETGLLAYYPFDEGTGSTAGDVKGTKHLAITGATWAADLLPAFGTGGSLHFDGTDDHATSAVGTTGQPNPANGIIIEGWVRLDTSQNTSPTIFGNAVLIAQQFNSNLYAKVGTSASVGNIAVGTATVRHVLVAWAGGTGTTAIQIYVDGSLAFNGSTTGTSTVPNFTTVGGHWNGTLAFDGQVARVAVYEGQYARAATIASTHYDAGINGIDPGGGDTEVEVGRATETDAARGLGAAKNKTTGRAGSVEFARALSAAKTRPVGRAVETGSAAALGAAKALGAGRAVEGDEARAVGVSKWLGVGRTAELDAAGAVTVARGALLGRVVELDGAGALGARKSLAVRRAAASEAARPLGAAKAVPVGRAGEADAARSLGRLKVLSVVRAVEVDAARALQKPLPPPSIDLPTFATLESPVTGGLLAPLAASVTLNGGSGSAVMVGAQTAILVTGVVAGATIEGDQTTATMGGYQSQAVVDG